MLKDTDCGSLRKRHEGKIVSLAGWVHRRRDHGGIIFVDLRDRSGFVQVVFSSEQTSQLYRDSAELRNEWVVQVTGQVALRPLGTENSTSPTGAVEVIARILNVLNPSKVPPFAINEDTEVDEVLRLRHRHLYLRRPRMLHHLTLRHRLVKFIRDFLSERNFLEIETPILIKSTPEGARDFLVPSRLARGNFFALPQSPQQLKQLLMVAGVERYFQIARCFRDEDLRADRQPEFTQLDLEMSFVERDDVLNLVEELFIELVEEVTPEKKVLKPFPRLTYQESLDRFGTDKPDLRFGLELSDLTALVAESNFQVFRTAVAEGGMVKGLVAPGCAGYTRRQLDELTMIAREQGAQGLVTIGLNGSGPLSELDQEDIHSPVARFLTPLEVRCLAEHTGALRGDLLLIVAGGPTSVLPSLNAIRQEMGRRLGLVSNDVVAFTFVLDFPLFEWDVDGGRWESMHHVFTAPHPDDLALLDSNPGAVRSQAYDLVLNEHELASGSIRIHQRALQERIFSLMGYALGDVTARFGHLLGALEYGAPPHGGIAPGIDRLAMILANEHTLREVIAFPKTQQGADLLFDAPTEVTDTQLRELGLKVIPEPGEARSE